MMIALRSPIFSAMAPKIGWPMPQARFWMAIASENSERSQPNSSAIGIWNTPKEARTAKLTMMMMQPTIRTGVNSGADRSMGSLLTSCGIFWDYADCVKSGILDAGLREFDVRVVDLAFVHSIPNRGESHVMQKHRAWILFQLYSFTHLDRSMDEFGTRTKLMVETGRLRSFDTRPFHVLI